MQNLCQCQSEAIQSHLEQQSLQPVSSNDYLSGNILSSVTSIIPLVHIEFFSSVSRGGKKHPPSIQHIWPCSYSHSLSGDGQG